MQHPLPHFLGDSFNSFETHPFDLTEESILSGVEDGRLIEWDAATGTPAREFVGHASGITSLAVAGETWTALSGSADGTLILWDLKTGDALRRFSGHNGPVTSVSITPGGQTAVSGGEDGALILWNVHSGEEFRRFTDQACRVNAVALSPAGDSILSTHRDLTLRKWDAQTGDLLATATIHCRPDHLALNADGTTVLVSCENIISQWDVMDWRAQQPFLGPDAAYLNALTISTDGHLGLSASSEGTLYLWDWLICRMCADLIRPAVGTPRAKEKMGSLVGSFRWLSSDEREKQDHLNSRCLVK